MTTRPVFSPVFHGSKLFKESSINFHWNPGFSETQKKKNIASLHDAAKRQGLFDILEISTKSNEEIGRRLSAFNLKYKINKEERFLECIYQGSKVFENGGPYSDLYKLDPRSCKKDERLRNSGNIISFNINGVSFKSIPFNAFYDWIYINSIIEHEDYIVRNLKKVDGFSDIEFNPSKSKNCQARSLAIFISLSIRGRLKLVADDYELFRQEIKDSFFDYNLEQE